MRHLEFQDIKLLESGTGTAVQEAAGAELSRGGYTGVPSWRTSGVWPARGNEPSERGACGTLVGQGQNLGTLVEFEAVILSCSLGLNLCVRSERSGLKCTSEGPCRYLKQESSAVVSCLAVIRAG